MHHTTPSLSTIAPKRKNERGAALISTLLISMLLLAAGGALIVSTAMTTSNTFDATAETQTYYSAEAGLQAALNVLRGRVTLSNPLRIDTTKAATEPENQIDFRKAVELGTSNDTTSNTTADASTDARLSRWLTYNTSNSTTANSNGPRVRLDNNFIGYSLKITDPDNSKIVTFSSSGSIDGASGGKTFPTGGGSATISVTASPSTTVTAYPTITGQELFRIMVSRSGGGTVQIPIGTTFLITIAQPTPFNTTATFRGTITPTNGSTSTAATIGPGSVNAALKLDSVSVSSGGGAVYKITNNTAGTTLLPLTLGTTSAMGSITASEPKRLLVQSTGSGPRGAVKQLQLLVRKGLDIPVVAPVVIRGADDGTVMVNLNLGNSNGDLTGWDGALPPIPMRPAVVVSNQDRNKAGEAIANFGNTGTQPGAPGGTPLQPGSQLGILDYNSPAMPATATSGSNTITVSSATATPPFLVTADKAREFLSDRMLDAVAQGRYFTPATMVSSPNCSGTVPTNAFYAGTPSCSSGTIAPKPAFTFFDGDLTLDGGAGLLIVTGTLTLNGGDGFNGIILVLGRGKVLRTGGGGGTSFGSFMVANFPRNSAAGTNDFGVPYYDMSGGGASITQSHSKYEEAAKETAGRPVLGIAEK